MELKPQILRDKENKPLFVVITLPEFKYILNELEELEDIRTLDTFETQNDKEFVSFRQALNEIRNGLEK